MNPDLILVVDEIFNAILASVDDYKTTTSSEDETHDNISSPLQYEWITVSITHSLMRFARVQIYEAWDNVSNVPPTTLIVVALQGFQNSFVF